VGTSGGQWGVVRGGEGRGKGVWVRVPVRGAACLLTVWEGKRWGLGTITGRGVREVGPDRSLPSSGQHQVLWEREWQWGRGGSTGV